AGADGKYTYQSEDGTQTIIDVPLAVSQNFETIVNNNSETVKKIIEQIVSEAEGNVTYNGTDLVYKDAKGQEQRVDLSSLVKANETITTIIASADGKYTYLSEDGTQTIIDVPLAVSQNFETIVNNNSEAVKKIIEQIVSEAEGNVTYNGTDLVYKDAKGQEQRVDLSSLVKANETITTLVAGADGKYTYQSEDGTQTIIDVPLAVSQNFETIVNNNSEAVKKIIEQIASEVEGNVTYNGTNLVYKDAKGVEQTVDLGSLVKANETVTTLVAGADGKYTYLSEDGTQTTIDVPLAVSQNFETIVNNNSEVVKKIIEQIASEVEGNVTYNGTNLVYKDAKGVEQTVDLGSLVKANETVTTLVAGADGKYTYLSEDGTQTTIDVPLAVSQNFETIVNNNSEVVKKIIEQIASEVEGNVTYNGTNLVYKDAKGVEQTVDLGSLVKANETVTTLVAGADGKYTYQSEDGTQTIIDVPLAVSQNFETIVNNNSEAVKKIIEQIASEVEGNVTYNGTNLVYKDAKGVEQTVDLGSLVKANETVTTLVAGADGKYTYQSEDGTQTVIDVPLAVSQNFETIVNNNSEAVKKIIEQIVSEAEGNVTYNGTDLVYKDTNGQEQRVDLSSFVKANETLTTLIDNTDGTYTYKSEGGVETIINVPDSVIKEFDKIIADTNVQAEIQKLFSTAAGGNVYFNGTLLEYTDVNGDKKEVNLASIVKSNETVTKLVNNNDGTYTYYNELGIDASGNPIANSGLSFKVPDFNSHILTGFISTGTYTSKSFDYSTMAYQATAGIFFNTNAIAGEVFSATIKTNNKPANTKYLQVLFEVTSGITTIGNYIGNNEVYAKVEFRVLVNDIEVKRFVDKFYRYGGYTFGLNSAYDSYMALIPLDKVTNLSGSNTVKITVRPASSTFNKNVGTSDGSIKSGANKAVTYDLKDVVIQVFEK
ncbi:hypothetical protein, partial [Flavobacterium sp. HSC-61S13]|uniref:hypothetical protein n=1 Tax=Flavobacterium sp. HSC-61S13 TaxID=2910963 RepID=UPI00209F02EE